MMAKKEKTQYCPYCGENHTYCIWCGEDLKKGHSEKCPSVRGIPKHVWGLEPSPKDMDWNLHLGRFGILGTLRAGPNGKPTFGPSDQEVKMRLIHEQFSFFLCRLNGRLLYLRQKLSNTQKSFLKRIFTSVGKLEKEISKLEKKKAELKKETLRQCDSLKLSKERKKYWRGKIEEVYSHGRFVLG